MSAQIIPMMRFKTGWLMLVLAVGIIVPTPSSARGLKLTAFGFRVGVSAMDSKADFKQYEILLISGPLWSWRWSSGWGLDTRLNATVGALRGGGETGLIGSLGPGIVLSRAGGRLSLDTGVSPTLLSRDEFGRADLGGQLHFISHIGLTLRLGRGLGVGYRFQHMSNAGIDKPNPGLDLHAFALNYHF